MHTHPICPWADNEQIYIDYHNHEWGKPIYDDGALFEHLLLEGFQAGLSWITILKKREHFRNAFDQFDYHKIATYTPQKIEELMQNPGIIRHRLKLQATITNAQAFIRIQEEFGSFSDYIWAFVDHQPILNHFQSLAEIPASTPVSDKIAKDLKKRGFKFVGSTTMYAFMQAIGMTNDHLTSCFKHPDYKAK